MITHLVDFFEAGALKQAPDKLALLDRDRRFSFCEWDRTARSVARLLVERGVAINQPIAVFLSKCADELVADLGILYAGCAFSNIDCSQPKPRLANLIANLAPPLALVGREYVNLAKEVGVSEDRIVSVDEAFQCQPADHQSLRDRRQAVIDTDPCCIINTSGSTGTPKSCALSHRGLIDFVMWFDDTFELGADEIVGSLSPFHFDGYIPGLFMALYRGATLNVIPSDLAMFPARLVQYLADNRISFIFWVPTVLVNIANADVLRDIRLPALKTVCFAGEVFPTKHCNYWRKHVPHAQFVNLYGPIEISVICTYYAVERTFDDSEPLPIGFACRNTDILILDDNNQACREQEVGELCVRGSSLANGYWNDFEKTEQAFCQNPLNKHYPEVIYRTGDLVSRNARNEIIFIGRKDFQVKHLGNRIDLGEIEHFAVQIPGVRNACVLYKRNEKQILLIYESDADISLMRVRGELGRNLPKIMWPTLLQRVAEMPRNANGKIDRQRLAGEYGT